MGYAIKKFDIDVLRTAGVSEDDIDHSVKVAEKALEIARRINGNSIDQEFVGRGALFHDLGKAKTQEMDPLGRPKDKLVPLGPGPYYAMKLWPCLLNTQGGPRRNEKAQVL